MKLVEYNSSHESMIENYYVKDDTYTGLPEKAVKIAALQDKYHPVLCIESDVLVTFFVLDGGDDKYTYTDQKDTLLLRSFSTDSRHLRKGYARKSLELLKAFVQENYSGIHEVILGVNLKNTPAVNLYQDCGFHDTRRTFDGAKGTQKILRMKI